MQKRGPRQAAQGRRACEKIVEGDGGVNGVPGGREKQVEGRQPGGAPEECAAAEYRHAPRARRNKGAKEHVRDTEKRRGGEDEIERDEQLRRFARRLNIQKPSANDCGKKNRQRRQREQGQMKLVQGGGCNAKYACLATTSGKVHRRLPGTRIIARIFTRN